MNGDLREGDMARLSVPPIGGGHFRFGINSKMRRLDGAIVELGEMLHNEGFRVYDEYSDCWWNWDIDYITPVEEDTIPIEQFNSILAGAAG